MITNLDPLREVINYECSNCGVLNTHAFNDAKKAADEIQAWRVRHDIDQEKISRQSCEVSRYREALEKIALRDSDDWIAEMTAEIAKDALEPVSEGLATEDHGWPIEKLKLYPELDDE